MTIEVTSQANDWSPEKVRARYLRYVGAYEWRWCEVGEDRRFDIRQGKSNDMRDFPFEVANAAIDRKLDGIWPSYVEWPLGFVGREAPLPIPAPPAKAENDA